MTEKDPWFVQERAGAFVYLLLTKRHDVVVTPQAGMVLDLLAEVRKGKKTTLRFFGVEIVADIDLPTPETATLRMLSQRSDATLPVSVFAVGVRKPEGIYCWSVEPVIRDGRATLERVDRPAWHALDEAGVDQLIGQVAAWYEALGGSGAAPRAGQPARA